MDLKVGDVVRLMSMEHIVDDGIGYLYGNGDLKYSENNNVFLNSSELKYLGLCGVVASSPHHSGKYIEISGLHSTDTISVPCEFIASADQNSLICHDLFSNILTSTNYLDGRISVSTAPIHPLLVVDHDQYDDIVTHPTNILLIFQHHVDPSTVNISVPALFLKDMSMVNITSVPVHMSAYADYISGRNIVKHCAVIE